MNSPRRRRARALASTVVAAVLLAGLGGCGLIGSGGLLKRTGLRVTTFYGTHTVFARTLSATDQGPALGLLERYVHVVAVGGRVRSIDGVTAGPHQAWSLYVNGILAIRTPTPTSVTPGDQLWWDLHSTLTGPASAAVVGDYPEPFANGSGGKRFPAVLTCAPGNGDACAAVGRSLTRADVKIAYQGFGTGSGSNSLAVLVGTVTQLRGVLADELLGDGPGVSGVFAQTRFGGRSSLDLLDPSGATRRHLDGDVGLIAATEQTGLNEPVWLISGTSPAGVRQAAANLSPDRLRNHYAVVVLRGGTVIPVPLSPVPGG